MTKTLMNSLSRTVNRAGLQLKKHSPEILVVAGVAGAVVSAIMACKATTKLNPVLDEAKENIDHIHQDVEEKVITVEESKKHLTSVYVKTGADLLKLYGPSIALGTLSITSILVSNNILHKRNLGLAAAYTAVDTGFKEYRNRVVERFGQDLDRELRYNVRTEKVEETVVDENGKEKTVETTVTVAEPSQHDEYTKCFTTGCKGHTKDPEKNLMYVLRTQDYMNDILEARGHVFLNEVYDAFGIPRTRAGQTVGWYYDPRSKLYENTRIDFGIYDLRNNEKCQFVNGRETSIWLNFNVTGPILNLI